MFSVENKNKCDC